LSPTTIGRIWRAFGSSHIELKSFKLSTGPLFVEKVRDIVGLYLDPPERAAVLCVDEKSQIQAFNRFEPILPMMSATPERRSHDYVRHGTTSLFAALDMASGKVIGSLKQRRRAKEFKKFLVQVDEEVSAEFEVHLVLDNYATHKTPDIKRWLLRDRRFHLHFRWVPWDAAAVPGARFCRLFACFRSSLACTLGRGVRVLSSANRRSLHGTRFMP
jgi:hypothetical protein